MTTPRWKDLHTPDTRQWVGLELTVDRRPTPTWRVETPHARHLRLVRDGRSLLWARIEPGYWNMWWLLGAEENPSCLSPLRARDVEALGEAPGSDAWFAAWARYFTRALDTSPHSPLHEGTWRLTRVVPHTPGMGWPREPEHIGYGLADNIEEGCPRTFAKEVHFGIDFRQPLLGLRHESTLSPSRLKVWRKRARDGTLPPVLTLYVSPLGSHVVLDGHHRWMAALEEQRPVPLLSLSHLRLQHVNVGKDPEQQQRVERIYHASASPQDASHRSAHRPISQERLNQLALLAWDSRPYVFTRTRAWPQPGGLAGWRSEVRERLAQLRAAVPPDLGEGFFEPEVG